MTTTETKLYAKVNGLTKKNAELKKKLAMMKNEYKDAIPVEATYEINKIYLYYAYLIFSNRKAMKEIELYAKRHEDVCSWETLAHDIVIVYVKYVIKKVEGKRPRCTNVLQFLVRDIYNIINR